MRIERTGRYPLGLLSFLLGEVSALWGAVLAPVYWMGFALLLPQAGRLGATHPALSPAWPLIGLALGALGMLAARSSRAPWSGQAAVGLALNALALLLALALGRAG